MESDANKDQNKREFLAYFNRLRNDVEIDQSEFESHWYALEDYDFSAGELTAIILNTANALTKGKKNQELVEFVNTHLIRWENKIIPLLGTSTDEQCSKLVRSMRHLGAQPTNKFLRLWKETFVAYLNNPQGMSPENFASSFYNFCTIAGTKNVQNYDSFMAESIKHIRAHMDDFTVRGLLNIFKGFRAINTVALDDVIESLFIALTNHMENEDTQQDHRNIFDEDVITKILMCASALAVPLPKNFSLGLLNKIFDKVNNPVNQSLCLYNLAIQHALTGSDLYEGEAYLVYSALKDLKTLNARSKRRIYQSCTWFGWDTKIECPPEDESGSRYEDNVRRELKAAGIKVLKKPLIVGPIGHHIDLAVKIGDVVMGVEIDGSGHLVKVFDDRKPEKSYMRYNGSTLFQTALITRCESRPDGTPGLHLIRIPYGSFLQAQREKQKIRYGNIRRLFKKAARKEPGSFVAFGRYGKKESVKPIPMKLHEGHGKLGYDPADYNFNGPDF